MSGITLSATNDGPNDPREWTPEEQALIGWFQAALKARKLPMEQFEFCSGVQVRTPSIMYGNWLIDIHAGPRGPRGHMGTLIDDLRRIKALVEGAGGRPSCPEKTHRGTDLF